MGLSGVYDIWFNRDNHGWQPWKTEFEGRSVEFTGEDGHTYAFEAAAWDYLGNLEELTGVAESKTFVDTTVGDYTAPGFPDSLTAGGDNPTPVFVVTRWRW